MFALALTAEEREFVLRAVRSYARRGRASQLMAKSVLEMIERAPEVGSLGALRDDVPDEAPVE